MQALITDAQVTALLPRCQRGETAAVEELYDLYADRLYRYICGRVGDPDVAADLTTDLFVRVIQRLGSFRLNRSRPAASFSAWLYQIAAHLAADYHRQQRRHPQEALDQQSSLAVSAANPERIVVQREAAQEVSRALEQLTEDQRLVIVAKFAENMDNADIAQWLGKSEGAVKSLQHRGLRTLGRLLASS